MPTYRGFNVQGIVATDWGKISNSLPELREVIDAGEGCSYSGEVSNSGANGEFFLKISCFGLANHTRISEGIAYIRANIAPFLLRDSFISEYNDTYSFDDSVPIDVPTGSAIATDNWSFYGEGDNLLSKLPSAAKSHIRNALRKSGHELLADVFYLQAERVSRAPFLRNGTSFYQEISLRGSSHMSGITLRMSRNDRKGLATNQEDVLLSLIKDEEELASWSSVASLT